MTDIFLVYHGTVVGVYTSLKQAVAYIKECVDAGDDVNDYSVYKPPINEFYEIGIDNEYLVEY